MARLTRCLVKGLEGGLGGTRGLTLAHVFRGCGDRDDDAVLRERVHEVPPALLIFVWRDAGGQILGLDWKTLL